MNFAYFMRHCACMYVCMYVWMDGWMYLYVCIYIYVCLCRSLHGALNFTLFLQLTVDNVIHASLFLVDKMLSTDPKNHFNIEYIYD